MNGEKDVTTFSAKIIWTIATFKLFALLYLGATSEMSFLSYFVIIPLLLLETLALAGFIYELTSNSKQNGTAGRLIELSAQGSIEGYNNSEKAA
ncbi:hypothetical protein [Aliikangiella coralliicola]|uniref:Uncharacterized protein n=1 Tax=Aliikangiella coralliicola TaxID=2592383 RepID=A0A545UAS9_9GAMM|nr:hypothetical protein [Aliikangiella coralliicola]TQV86570.1 hypothetical protein FLL46_16845 [Aliikangiella coralliicola]